MWIPSMEIPRKGGNMEIRTKDGMMIYCLPDNARCKLTGRNPESMCECPIFNFDDLGDICVPELCEEYEEE